MAVDPPFHLPVYAILHSPVVQVSNWNYQLNLNTPVQLPRNTSWQANGSYTSRRVQLQGQAGGFQYYSISARKAIQPQHLTLTGTFGNPFRLYNVVPLRTPTFFSNGVSYAVVRTIRLTLSWRFGKLTSADNREKNASAPTTGSGNNGPGRWPNAPTSLICRRVRKGVYVSEVVHDSTIRTRNGFLYYVKSVYGLLLTADLT